jgi:hypothetical protein
MAVDYSMLNVCDVVRIFLRFLWWKIPIGYGIICDRSGLYYVCTVDCFGKIRMVNVDKFFKWWQMRIIEVEYRHKINLNAFSRDINKTVLDMFRGAVVHGLKTSSVQFVNDVFSRFGINNVVKG